MQTAAAPLVAKTTTDMVFDILYGEISSLVLLPGARISETDVAERLGVSRQPVRDAFNRLANLDLLLIRPQRATVVRGFSYERIQTVRFVRLAVELEVITQACAHWDATHDTILAANIAEQAKAVRAGRIEDIHALDYDFHKYICDVSGYPLAFETIQKCKHSVDRLCVLSLKEKHEAVAIVEDHQAIADALAIGSVEQARTALTRHLSRLDRTIQEIHEHHADYFE